MEKDSEELLNGPGADLFPGRRVQAGPMGTGEQAVGPIITHPAVKLVRQRRWHGPWSTRYVVGAPKT